MESGTNFNIDTSKPLFTFDDEANKTLDAIYSYLTKKSADEKEAKKFFDSSLNNQNTANEIARGQSKASSSNDRAVQKALSGINSSQKKSMASEANNRAIDKALAGKQHKDNLNALKDLKDTFKNVLNDLKNSLLGVLNDTLKTQTQYAKLMRQNFLTKEEKDRSQMMANEAQGQVEDLLGFKLDKSEIVEYYNALQAGGHDLEAMGEEQRAKYAALRKSGLDDAEAYKYAMEASTEAVKQITTAATDPRARQLIKQQLATVSESERATVGVDKVISQIAQSSASTAKYAGGAITDWEKAAQMAANNRRAANGITEEVDGALLAIQGGIQEIGSEGQNLVEKAGQYSTEQLRAMASSSDESTRQMANQMLTIKNMQANGQNVGTNLRTREQNEQALSDNASDGKIKFELQKAFGQFDNAFLGGAAGKFANTLDELFGDSADMGKVVTTGFKLVSGLLKAIWLNSSSITKWILGGLGAAGAIIAIVANWDKIKPKLGEIFDNIKPMLAEFISKVPGFIQDVISGISDLLPEIWKGIKSAISGFFGDGGMLGKAGSSISGAIDGLKSKLSGSDDSKAMVDAIKTSMSNIDMSKTKDSLKNAGGSLKNASTSVGEKLKEAAPTFKGFFDGIGKLIGDAVPAIKDIVLKVVECINKLIDAIAPAIPAIVQVLQTIAEAVFPAIEAIRELGLSLIDCIKVLGVDLIDSFREIIISTVDAVREVIVTLVEPIRLISEGVNVLAKAIAENLPTILDIIGYGIKQVLPKVLGLLDKFITIILPPVIDIVKRAVETLLPPIVDAFTKLVDVLMPPIAAILETVAGTVDRIVNLILELIEPPLKAISDLITTIIDLVKNIAKFVNDIVVTANGLFNYFVSKIPTVIGWLSGTVKYLQEGLGPVVSSGLEIIRNGLDTVWSYTKEFLIKFIAAPLTAGFNTLNLVVKSIQYALLKKFDFFGENEETAQARKDFEAAKAALLGKESGSAEEERFNAAKKAFEEALSSKDADKIAKARNELVLASEAYQSEHMAMITKAEADRKISEANTSKAVDNFKTALNSDAFKNGIQFDQSAADDVQKYLDAARDQQQIATLPPNTGSLLETISKSVTANSEFVRGIYEFLTSLNMHEGGTPRTTGAAIVGEKGGEAVLPLEKPSLIKKIIERMSPRDRKNVTQAVVSTALGNSIAENAIAYARDQVGKPYSIYSDGFVCNTLVQSAFRSAGFKQFPSGTVSTHWKNPKLHRVNLDDAVPGMIGFSNKSDNTGFPQHMGIITTDGKWVNASGSAVNGNYKKGQFQATPTSKGVVEVPMNRKAKWGMVAAGFYDGMFDEATSKYIATKQLGDPDGIVPSPAEQAAQNTSAQEPIKEMTPEEYSKLYSGLAEGTDLIAEGAKAKQDTPLETLQNLSRSAINAVITQTNGQVRYDVSNSKAKDVANNKDSSKDEIVLAMKDVVRYLRDMASFVKRPAGASAPARLPHA